jgi:hypothetical protein
VAVEVLAERLGVKLKDYAVGGAKSGYGNADDYWLEGLKNTGIQAQVEQYKATRTTWATQNDLVS